MLHAGKLEEDSTEQTPNDPPVVPHRHLSSISGNLEAADVPTSKGEDNHQAGSLHRIQAPSANNTVLETGQTNMHTAPKNPQDNPKEVASATTVGASAPAHPAKDKQYPRQPGSTGEFQPTASGPSGANQHHPQIPRVARACPPNVQRPEPSGGSSLQQYGVTYVSNWEQLQAACAEWSQQAWFGFAVHFSEAAGKDAANNTACNWPAAVCEVYGRGSGSGSTGLAGVTRCMQLDGISLCWREDCMLYIPLKVRSSSLCFGSRACPETTSLVALWAV